ncbi:unnamed protein product, partial [Iphiclides podalirius]
MRERREKADLEEVDMGRAAVEASDVESLLRSYYATVPPERRLAILSVRAITEAVRDFTLKRDDGVFRRVLEGHRRRCVDFLLESTAETAEEVRERIRLCKQSLDATDEQELRGLIEKAAASRCKATVAESEESEPEAEAGRGRGRGARGGGAGGGAGRARAAGAAGRARAPGAASPVSSPSPPQPAPERRTPRRLAARKSNELLQNLAAERTLRRRRDSSEIEISD